MYHTDYQLQEEIGNGCFGAVYKGILNIAVTSPVIEKHKLQSMSRGESMYTVAVKVMKGIRIHVCTYIVLKISFIHLLSS